MGKYSGINAFGGCSARPQLNQHGKESDTYNYIKRDLNNDGPNRCSVRAGC